MSLRVISIVSLLSSVVIISPALAERGGFEEALQYRNFPITEYDSSLCYAKTDSPKTFDLTRLCGFVGTPVSTDNSVYSGGGGGSYGGGVSSGKCNYSSDIASDGSRCGGRASSEKTGGR